MAFRVAVWRNALRRKSSLSRKTTDISSIILPPEVLMEEETLPHYKAEQYYPVKIGDVYGARYEVAGKIGYGAYSTSWLCRDLPCVPLERPSVASSCDDQWQVGRISLRKKHSEDKSTWR